ncbi:hypothetical protein D3C79_644240 [compost metagenome]
MHDNGKPGGADLVQRKVRVKLADDQVFHLKGQVVGEVVAQHLDHVRKHLRRHDVEHHHGQGIMAFKARLHVAFKFYPIEQPGRLVVEISPAYTGNDLHCHVCERLQHPALSIIHGLTRGRIDNAETANRDLFVHQQRSAAIVANAGCTGDQRVFGKARVQRRIQYFQRLRLKNGMGTERHIPRRAVGLQCGLGHEPLLALADDRDQAHRRIEVAAGPFDQCAQLGAAVLVRNTPLSDRSQALLFIGRHRGDIHVHFTCPYRNGNKVMAMGHY